MLSQTASNAARLVRLDLGDRRARRCIAEDPRYDVAARLTPTRKTQRAAGRRVHPRTGAEWRCSTTRVARRLRRHPRRSSAATSSVVSRDDADDQTWLVAFTDDDGPVAVLRLRPRDQEGGTFLFEHQPELASYKLAPMEPITFTARDGLTIHGYLTLPVGRRARRTCRRC